MPDQFVAYCGHQQNSKHRSKYGKIKIKKFGLSNLSLRHEHLMDGVKNVHQTLGVRKQTRGAKPSEPDTVPSNFREKSKV